jgi:hypothetical protein
MNIQQTQSQAARFNDEPKRAPRLKPGEKVYYNGRIMVVVSHSGHRRIEDFVGGAVWVPLYELAPATRQGSARKRARTISQPEHHILKDFKP